MSTPRRIQLSRGRGSRLPAGARSVSRPTRFGNPYKVQPHGPWTLAESLALFERDLLAGRLMSAPGRGPTTLEEVRQLARA